MSRNKLRLHRHARIRTKLIGNKKSPRLSVFISLNHVYAQLIDDQEGHTLASANDYEIENTKNPTENAAKVGELLAKKAHEKKIKQVVFDRGGYKYHGKIKALAESARKNGLEF